MKPSAQSSFDAEEAANRLDLSLCECGAGAERARILHRRRSDRRGAFSRIWNSPSSAGTCFSRGMWSMPPTPAAPSPSGGAFTRALTGRNSEMTRVSNRRGRPAAYHECSSVCLRMSWCRVSALRSRRAQARIRGQSRIPAELHEVRRVARRGIRECRVAAQHLHSRGRSLWRHVDQLGARRIGRRPHSRGASGFGARQPEILPGALHRQDRKKMFRQLLDGVGSGRPDGQRSARDFCATAV